MALYDPPPTGKLTTKISPLIDGQLPDFIQADHPIFSSFLKNYYEYLEAGELRLTVSIDNLLLELETVSKVLDVNGNDIILESSGGKFIVGETITGGTSKATAKVLVDDLSNTNPRLFITSQQKFETGETITGGSSNASGTITRYRANPVQTIQQLLSYADIDNTIYDFLDNFRDEFMNAIPLLLTEGVDKRKLVKNIRELYRAKGTSEGHKIFMRMLLGEEVVVNYPNKYMMRVSDGNWSNKTIMRVSPSTTAIGSEVVGVTLTGKSSGATAIVASAKEFVEGNTLIVEFELNPDSLKTAFTFTDGEIVTATSTVQDVAMTFTVKQIVATTTATDGGAIYAVDETFVLDTNTNIGNGLAEGKIESINEGSVNGVVIDDAGTLYEVGDAFTFTTTDSNTSSASGFVSIIDGSLVLEGTDALSTNAGDFIISESATNAHIDFFEIELERSTTGTAGESLILDNAYDTTIIQVESGVSSSGNIVLNGTDLNLTNGGDALELEAYHDVAASNAGHNIKMETSANQISRDTYTTGSDRFALEETTDYSGGISRVFLKDGGQGYLTIPTVTVTSTTGTGTALLATTDNIGSVGDTVIVNQGFNYSSAPELVFKAKFTLKDITGTFAASNTLTTHTGTISSFDSSTNILKTSFEDVVRVTLETGDEEEIALEDSLRVGSDVKVTTIGINRSFDEEDNIVDVDGIRIALNAEDTLDGYMILEAGTGQTSGSAIIQEVPDNEFFPPIQLETSSRDGTSIGDGIANESGTGDILVLETAESLGDNPAGGRIVHEDSQLISSRSSGAGTFLITNASEDTDPSTIILNGTDSSLSNAGGDLLNEEHGNNNTIILNGTDSDSTNSGAKLLQNVPAASGVVALNGTDSDSTNVGDSIINQDAIDFFSDATGINPHPTTITDSSGATAKIVKANIAKGSSTIATTMETSKTYGTNIESLIGEDLNRIQDSYYYQQFSYEIQAGFGTNTYLDKLKKAVHPAGWIVFGKVKVTSSISAAITNAGSSLGGGYYSDLAVTAPEDKFSPILASTFEILFSEKVQRRLGVADIAFGGLEEQIILEEAEDINVAGDSIILDGSEVFEVAIEAGGTDGAGTNAGDNIVLNGTDGSSTNANDQIIVQGYSNAGSYIIEEAPLFAYIDFVGVELEGATDTSAGGNGIIVLNGTDSSSTNVGDKIISEKSEAVTTNLILNNTGDSAGNSDVVTRADAGGDILLDGTDSSSTNAGDSMELEDVSAGIIFNKFGLQPNNALATLLNEDGGSQQLETSSKGGGSNYENSLVSFITTKIDIPAPTPRHLSTGLVTLGRNPFSNPAAKFELEKGTATSGYLLINKAEYQTPVNDQGHTLRDPAAVNAGSNLIFENATDANNDSSFTFENIGEYSNNNIVAEFSTIVLNGTDSSSTNAGDNVVLDGTDSSSTNEMEKLIIEASVGPANMVLNGTDSSSKNAGESLIAESVYLYNSFILEDIIRPSLIVLDSSADYGPTGGSTPVNPVGIILEESGASGSFRQEDGTTVASTHGDNMLLEDKTGFGTNNKLIIESDRLILENKINKGTIPFQNYTNSTLEPITRPADITISEYGAFDLEEGVDSGAGKIVLNGTDGSSTNAGNRIRFEPATDDNINFNYPSVAA